MISIIICTRNRPTEVRNCIGSVLSQIGNFEVIIVDQSDVQNDYPLDDRLRIFKSEERGLSIARNTGIRNSSGDILAFVDDDAVVCKNYVKELERSFFNTDIDAVAGRILISETEIPYARTQTTKSRILSPQDWMVVLGGNMAFRRQVFDKVGYFDERFGAGREWASGEETDIFFRMNYLGSKMYYSSESYVYHPEEARGHSSKSLFRKHYAYGKGQGALFAKHYKEFRNRKILLSFIWSLTKPSLRIMQYLLIREKVHFKVHYSILSGRVNGFREFLVSTANFCQQICMH